MDARRSQAFAGLALLALGAALCCALPAAADATPGFTVSGTTAFERMSLHVEGAITVADGGSLTLDAVDLYITSAPGAPAALIVQPGGSLTVTDSTLRSDTAGFRFEVYGAADVRSSTILGVASDPARPLGRALDGGNRIAGGGVLLAANDVLFQQVQLRGAVGCGFTIEGASPALLQVDVSQIEYRVAGPDGNAAAVCVVGGSPFIEGLSVSAIGTGAPGTPSSLRAAAVIADGPKVLTVRGLTAISFVPARSGLAAPYSVGIMVQDPSFLEITGGQIRGATDGIILRGYGNPASGGSVVVKEVTIVALSGGFSQTGAFLTDPGISLGPDTIDTCGATNGIYVESQNSGVASTVTVTVTNVTTTSCGQSGINLFNNGATGPHYFNVWDSNTSLSGRYGFYLHGANMGAGLNVQMANNSAWRNNWAGFVVETTYAATAGAKLASCKLDNNIAQNNSAISSTYNGGFILTLGAPTTESLIYNLNVARGNGGSGIDYGHYIAVAVTQSLTIGGGFFSNLVAHSNGEFGIALVGGTSPTGRFDKARIRDSVIINHSTAGLYGYYGRIEIWNSTMSNQLEFQGVFTAFFAMGTEHARTRGTTTGPYKIISYKQICMHGTWQNGAPLYLIPLTFINGNNSAAAMYSDVSVDPPVAAAGRQTDANGNWSGWALDWTFDPQAPASQQTIDLAPLTIAVQVFQDSAKAGPFDMITNICGPIQFVDLTPPDIFVDTPIEDATYTTSNLSVSGNVNDGLSGLAGLQVSLDGSLWVNLTVAPGLFSYKFANLSDGTYDVHIRAWDKANDGLDPRNESHVIIFRVTIDTIAPTLTLQQPEGAQDGSVIWTSSTTIFFRGTVDLSVVYLYINGQPVPITGTAFIFPGDLPNEGPQTFLFLAIDAAGNAKTIKVTVILDRVAPTLIITKPAQRGDVYVNTHLLEVEGITDANVVVKINGVNATIVGTTFHLDVDLVEGRNVLNITAEDAAKNPASRQLIVYSDTIAPRLSLTSHTDGMYMNTSRAELVGDLSETVALFEVNLRIFSVPGLAFDALLGLAEGANRLSINATDRAGNVGHLEIRVTVDTIAPEITVIALPDFLVRNGAVLNIVGQVSENSTVRVKGTQVDVVDLQFDTSVNLLEGTNTIEFTATDLAGNKGTLVRRVILDTTQPTLTITEPGAGEVVHSSAVHIVGTSEPGALLEVGGQLVLADATGKFSAWVNLDHAGANAIQVTVTDAAGNSLQDSYTVNYAALAVDTGADLQLGFILLAALGAALAVASMFLARRKVDTEVEDAQSRKQQAQADDQGTPGYTEQQQPDPGYYAAPPEAPPADYQAPAGYEPQQGYDAQPGYAQGGPEPSTDTQVYPDAAPAPPPPRPPRPPRPPSN